MESKPLWKSKTFWFAVLFAIVNIAGLFGFETYQPDPLTTEIVGIVVAALTVVLRLLTKQPIG